MGERGIGVNEPESHEPVPVAGGDSPSEPRAIEQEIASVRSELGDLVDELDRRRHEVVDLPLQAERHPAVVALAGATALLLVTAFAMWIYRRTRPEPRLTKARKLGQAIAIASHNPDALLNALQRRPDPRTSLFSGLVKVASTAGQRAVARAI